MKMTLDQMDKLAKILLGPPRVGPDDIYIHPDGEPEVLKRTDPPFFKKVLSDRPRYVNAPNDGVTRKRRSIPDAVKREVLERDGSRCYLCGSGVLMDGLHFDHIIPVSRGGTNDADNIGVACAMCNLQKNDRLTDRRPEALQ